MNHLSLWHASPCFPSTLFLAATICLSQTRCICLISFRNQPSFFSFLYIFFKPHSLLHHPYAWPSQPQIASLFTLSPLRPRFSLFLPPRPVLPFLSASRGDDWRFSHSYCSPSRWLAIRSSSHNAEWESVVITLSHCIILKKKRKSFPFLYHMKKRMCKKNAIFVLVEIFFLFFLTGDLSTHFGKKWDWMAF